MKKDITDNISSISVWTDVDLWATFFNGIKPEDIPPVTTVHLVLKDGTDVEIRGSIVSVSQRIGADLKEENETLKEKVRELEQTIKGLYDTIEQQDEQLMEAQHSAWERDELE